jgi:hypothetical protein
MLGKITSLAIRVLSLSDLVEGPFSLDDHRLT